MFSPSPKIQFENELSNKILLEGAKNDVIKQTLQDLADVLRDKILMPLLVAVDEVNEFNELEPDLQGAIIKLASQHTNEDRQYGGLLRKIPDSKQIISNPATVKKFLQTLDAAISHIRDITNKEILVQSIKVIVDLGFTYTVFLNTWHTQDFQTIYDHLYPSPEEFKVRLSIKELGMSPQVSLTLGIGRESGEVIPAIEDKNGMGFYSGKAAYLIVDMEKRLKLMAKQHDDIFLETNEKNRHEKLAQFYIDCKIHFGSPLTEEFKKHTGTASKNFAFAEWAKKIEPSSIKLIRSVDSPLVASISGTMARLLVTLEDLHAFDNENGVFNSEKAQILANMGMAFLGRASHHAAEESIETYRRFLDYILLNPKRKPLPGQTIEQVPDRIPAEFSKQMDLNVRAKDFDKRIDSSIQDGSALEARVGYPKVGDYHSFLHEEFKKILLEPKKIQKENYRISPI